MAKQEDRSSKIFGNTLIYMVSGLMLKCFSFFLLPLYTSYLTTADYGITSLTSSFLTTASFITSLSLFSSVFRFYVDLKHDSKKLKRFYGSITIFVFGLTLVSIFVMSLFKTWIIKYIFVGMDFYPTVIITLISLLFYCQYTIYEQMLKGQQQAIKYAKVTISYFILTLIANITFVVYFKMGATGVLIANLITYFLFTLVFWIDLRRSSMVEWCLDWAILKEALRYSLPIIPHNLSTQLALLISKIFIGDSSSLADVGLYAIASQFGNMADVVQNYVNSAYGPWLYEQLNDFKVEMRGKISSVAHSLVFLLGFFLLGIALFAHDFIILFLSKDYALAWVYVPAIVWVLLVKTIYYFYVEILFYHKNASHLIFISTLSSSLLNIVLSYYSIRQFGVLGSIGADFVSMVVRVTIIVLLSKRFEDIGLRVKNFIFCIFIISLFMSVGLYFTYSYYQITFSINDFIYRVIVILLYLGIFAYRYKQPICSFLGRKLKRRLHES